MAILESDWKTFKELRKLALDRFCQGVLAETQIITQNSTLSAHARYLTLYRMMRSRDKDMAAVFDGPDESLKRSAAFDDDDRARLAHRRGIVSTQ